MSHPTIMLVDDDPGLLTGLTTMLQFRLPNIRVTPFDSPRTALTCFETTEFDAIVTDLRMKELDGLALLRQVHAVRPHVPVVMMSGHAEQAIASEAIRVGAFECVSKPIDRNEFVDIIKQAVKAHRLSRDVKASQLLLSRFAQRVARLDELVQVSLGRPVTIQHLQQRIETSRQLNQSSIVLLKRILKETEQRTAQTEAALRDAEQHLQTLRQEARRRTAARYGDRISLY